MQEQLKCCGEVAQFGRALGLGPSGRRFKSCLLHHLWGGSSPGQSACLARRRQRVRVPSSPPFGAVAQLVRASGSYPEGQEFDSLWRYHTESQQSFDLDPQLSWLEQPAHNRSVTGSSPVGSTMGNYPSLAEGNSLENCKGLHGPRGFESLIARHIQRSRAVGSSLGS